MEDYSIDYLIADVASLIDAMIKAWIIGEEVPKVGSVGKLTEVK